ncbi:3-oxoadipate enol-lactonase [Mangrovihabitans endophyticus]|uniref:3-oxoadipate enol-lactonase n=1 Tax=Mangrovihabitans endophyticus TaxID=1751298 RepID=A0A8J3BZS7_9ACTN|nr:3-oxoadipate enol-lactonase [Mangrovihabitans endophyticus]GGK97586.1 3-oxoadipate enol-lactonase [Mangrovihabitans endophyticus]
MTVRLHRRLDGPPDAPPVLLINSLGTDHTMWEPQMAVLAAQHRVIRYDVRGHGCSSVPAGPYSLADLGQDALGLLDALGVPRAHVVGLSLGGMTAMWLAAHAPHRVGRLVLCCTSAQLGPAQQWADRAETVRRQGLGAIATAVIGRWLTPPYASTHPDDVRRLRAMLTATPPAGYAGACAAIENMDLRSDLDRITARTLVLSGNDDEAIPPMHGAQIAGAIPDARLVVVRDAAHLATWQQPRIVNPLILEALDG